MLWFPTLGHDTYDSREIDGFLKRQEEKSRREGESVLACDCMGREEAAAQLLVHLKFLRLWINSCGSMDGKTETSLERVMAFGQIVHLTTISLHKMIESTWTRFQVYNKRNLFYFNPRGSAGMLRS